MRPPVGVGLEHLTDQASVTRLPDRHQHDRKVAGDSVGPQTGLTLAVLLFDAVGRRPKEGIRIEEMGRQFLEVAGIVGLNVK